MKIIKYLAIFFFGFLVAKLIYDKKTESNTQEEIQVISNGVKNLSKLVVSEGSFSEIYNFTDTKKAFYDFFEFKKKAIVTVNAKVEVGYDLSKLDIQIDSIGKRIVIREIPKEEVVISPDIKYFDLQESQFNSFTPYELNKLNRKAINKIKETVEVTNLKAEAKTRLFEELSKIYQLSKVYNWKVVDNTNEEIFKNIML